MVAGEVSFFAARLFGRWVRFFLYFICKSQKIAVPLQPLSKESIAWVYRGESLVLQCIEYYSYRDVAQSGSATVWGTGGRKFKSCHPDNTKGKNEGAQPSFFV